MNADKARRKELKNSFTRWEAEQEGIYQCPISREDYERLVRFLQDNVGGSDSGLDLTKSFLQNNSLPMDETVRWLKAIYCDSDQEVLDWGLFVIEPLPTKNNSNLRE